MIDKLKLFAKKYLRFASQFKTHYFYSEISKIDRCDVLLFCHDDDRGLTLNGLAYAPLIDSIYEEFARSEIKCQAISLPWSRLGLKKTVNGSLLFNRNYLIQLIKNKIFKSKFFYAYDIILKKSQARFVIGIGLPSDLCLAAKKHNVTTAELLHGMGYRFIPWGWDKLPVNQLPSKVLVLDDVSRETFKPLESKGLSVIKVPHPFYKKIIDPKYFFPTEWIYDEKGKGKNILVTLQWGYDGEVRELDGVLNNGLFYEGLEALINKRRDLFWHFRLHPVQMKGAIAKRIIPFMTGFANKHSNLVWVKSSAVPLANVAAACELHITMSSMSCYDVSMLGLPSLVLCPTTRDVGYYKDYFSDLVEEGYVTKSSFDVDLVEDWINSTEKKSPRLMEDSSNAWSNLLWEIKNKL